MKSHPPGSPFLAVGGGEEGSAEGKEAILTVDNFAALSGREEMTGNRLKTSQNRFLMHRSYSEECYKESYWDKEPVGKF